MHRVPDLELFSRADAHALGWSDSALGRAVRSGRVVRLRRGQFASGAASPELAALAAARAHSAAVISHRSALLLHGLPLVGVPAPFPELTVVPLGPVDIAGAHMHRAALPDDHITMFATERVTTVARTLVDVARHRSLSTSVAAIDAALHRELVTLNELLDVVRRCANWPRIRRARRALGLVDARAESPLESVSRIVLRWLKLPMPDLQPWILDEFGNVIGRLDFYWDECGVFGEADGRSKYDTRQVLTDEKQRHEDLEDTGLVGVRWGWSDITREPRYTRYRIERAFQRGARRDRSGFTRLWSVRPT